MPPLDGLDVVLVSIAADLDDAHAAAKRDSAEGRTAAEHLASLQARAIRLERSLEPTAPRAPSLAKPSQPTSSVPAAREASFVALAAHEWSVLREQAEARLIERGLDIKDVSLDLLLDPEEVRRIERRFAGDFELRAHLDAYDVVVMAAAGMVAAALDFFLVRIPRDTLYEFAYQQKGSPITKFLQSRSVHNDNWLSELCKAPFDHVDLTNSGATVPGLSGRTHRMHTLGHDPLLGLFFGTWDFIRGGMTAIDESGKWQFVPDMGTPQADVLVAMAKELLHLLSDAPTKMGLPIPGWPLLNMLQVGSFGPKGRTIEDLARYMYLKGYDCRHFLTMSTSVVAAEIILRGYFPLRSWVDEEFAADVEHQAAVAGSTRLADHPRFQAMALGTHLLATAANAGKVGLCYQGNPLAINYAQWLRFFHAAFEWARTRMRGPSHVISSYGRANLLALQDGWPSFDWTERGAPKLTSDGGSA